MSQTRQPIHVFPKITLKFGFWGRVTVIIVILTVIASILLYYHGNRYKKQERQHYQEISQQLQLIQEQTVQIQSKNQLLQQKVDSLESQLAQLKKQVQPTQKPYALIKQVQHYVDLAEQHLWLQHDSQSASQLLAIADELLQHYGNQQTLALRQAIAADQLLLSQVQHIDVAGISLKIEALKQSAQQLTLPPSKHNHIPQSQATNVEQSAWEKGWLALQKLISIQHHNQTIAAPLLTQEQRVLVQQNVYLALQQAQMALWSHQTQRYQQSLTNVEQLLTPYQQFNPHYAVFIKEIQLLKQQPMHELIVKLTNTPSVLAQLLTQHTESEPSIPSQQDASL